MTKLNTTRRQLLKVGLGAAQVAMLERFGLSASVAHAAGDDAPTRLVTIYIQGGYRPQFMWWGQDDAQVDVNVPPPGEYAGEPVFFKASDLVDLGTANGNYKPLRLWRSWDPAMPGRRSGRFTPLMYGWEHFGLAEQTCVLHGIDQGTNAHASGYVAAMCGVAGGDYRAPAVQSVVANHFYERFKSTRPLPCVTVNSYGMPVAAGLPSHAAPILVPSIDALKPALSGKASDNWWWKGLEARRPYPEVDASGMALGGQLSATTLEAFSLSQVKPMLRKSSAKVDSLLEGIHGSLRSVSRALAADVVTVLQATKGVDHLYANRPAYLSSYFDGPFDYTFGLANYHAREEMAVPFEMALRLMKADLTSAVHVALQTPYYDTHNGSYGQHFSCAHGRAEMDCIARFLGEMKNSPAPGKPGKSLLDDTLVMIFSEFGRSWANGRSQSDPASWNYPDDHHPITSVTYVGGNVAGRRQVGSYTTDGIGTDVAIVEENGQTSRRQPRASDATATALRVLGLKFDEFFIPGGFGEVVGIRRGT